MRESKLIHVSEVTLPMFQHLSDREIQASVWPYSPPLVQASVWPSPLESLLGSNHLMFQVFDLSRSPPPDPIRAQVSALGLAKASELVSDAGLAEVGLMLAEAVVSAFELAWAVVLACGLG